MDKNKQTPNGWKSFRFAFGKDCFQETQEQDRAREDIYQQEEIGYGCYRATVDFDALDRNQ